MVVATGPPNRVARSTPPPQPIVGRVPEAHPGIKEHRRFTLREVSLGGLPVGDATVDAWHDASGAERWSARLLIRIAHPLREGLLAGTAVDGQRLCGRVHLGETTAGPRRGREVLVEFHGDGELSLEDQLPGEPRTFRATSKRDLAAPTRGA